MYKRTEWFILCVLILSFATSSVWSQGNQIVNSEFDDDLNSWGRYGTTGFDVTVVQGVGMSGKNAVVLDVTNAAGTASIGIAQSGLLLEPGVTYPIGFTARAEEDREMVVLVQTNVNNASWPTQLNQKVQLTTEAQPFLIEYTHSGEILGDDAGEGVNIYLMLKGQWWAMQGNDLNKKVWIDRVYFGEEPPLPRQDLADYPAPIDVDTDVPRTTELGWQPGIFAATHDVYLGSSFEDVNDATRQTPLNVLVSQDQSSPSYTPDAVLDFGQTYYWRIDEVNAAPDSTVIRGDVWSFTVEPKAIPIASVTASASGANLNMGPEKTIDGSGLNALDQHSTEPTAMWLAGGPDPIWIQYDFDKVYKLHEMLVWNSNQLIEAFLGFGVKEITVDYSVDGETWSTLDGPIELAKAPGTATYEANTAVDFGGIMAQSVKLSVASAHGMSGQSGLSEVRFMAIPTWPREPQPANGETTAGVEVALQWRSGREAVSHEIYLGTNSDNLALVETTTNDSVVTDSLDYGTTYAWSVTEVNDAAVPMSHTGEVWTFTTPDYGVVEDFEAFTGDEGQEVFMTWLDGYGGESALGGSITGHIDSPYVETSIVNPGTGGSQSLPIYVDNDGGFIDIDGNSSSPTFSEVVRAFDSAQNWTNGGIKTLSIMFRGSAGLTGQLYCKIGNAKLLYDGDAANMGIGAWQAWNIDLSAVSGNLTNVRELAIGVEGGGSGLLYIDDIRLYPKVGEIINPTEPDSASLMGLWNFDEGAGAVALDSSGNGNDGTFGSAQWVPGQVGTALEFVRADQVDCGDVLALTEGLTIACWVNPTELLGEKSFVTRQGAYVLKASENLLRFTTPGITDYTGTQTPLEEGVWQHVAVTFVPNQADGLVFYLNGLETQRLNHTGGSTSDLPAGTGPFQLGNNQWDQFYLGKIDDVRIYNAAVSPGEILWLAGRTLPIHKSIE